MITMRFTEKDLQQFEKKGSWKISGMVSPLSSLSGLQQLIMEYGKSMSQSSKNSRKSIINQRI
jgi:hypothetical protein